MKDYHPKKLCHRCDRDESDYGELFIIDGEKLCYQCATIKIEEMWNEMSFEDKCDLLDVGIEKGET